jgi:hypothetical protein
MVGKNTFSLGHTFVPYTSYMCVWFTTLKPKKNVLLITLFRKIKLRLKNDGLNQLLAQDRSLFEMFLYAVFKHLNHR